MEWATQVRDVKQKLDSAETKAQVAEIWSANLNLGHRLLGRILVGRDVEKIITEKNVID